MIEVVEQIVKKHGLRLVKVEDDEVEVCEIQLPDGRPIMLIDSTGTMCMDDEAELEDREYVIVSNLIRDLHEAGFKFDWPEDCKKVKVRP